MAWLEREVTRCLISSSLFPVKGEVFYVYLALHILVPLLPIVSFIVSIPVKFKTDVAAMEG